MDKYTYSNLIIDPTKEGIESLIGKEVYFEANPFLCLKSANEKLASNLGILVEVYKDSINPFCVKDKSGSYKYPCIIEKKEEPKPECVPFESMEEFVRRYKEVMEGAEFDSFEDNLFQCGMWLRDADADTDKPMYRLVYEIRDKGIRIPDYGFLDWENLLHSTGLTFLDGTPCGKLMEDKND